MHHTFYPFKVYNSVGFRFLVCAVIITVISTTFSSPQNKTKGFRYSPTLAMQVQSKLSLLSIFIDFLCSEHFMWIDSHYLWSFVTGFFCLHNVFKVHPGCSMNQQFISSCGQIIFHYMDIPYYVHALASCWEGSSILKGTQMRFLNLLIFNSKWYSKAVFSQWISCNYFRCFDWKAGLIIVSLDWPCVFRSSHSVARSPCWKAIKKFQSTWIQQNDHLYHVVLSSYCIKNNQTSIKKHFYSRVK